MTSPAPQPPSVSDVLRAYWMWWAPPVVLTVLVLVPLLWTVLGVREADWAYGIF